MPQIVKPEGLREICGRQERLELLDHGTRRHVRPYLSGKDNPGVVVVPASLQARFQLAHPVLAHDLECKARYDHHAPALRRLGL
ncbi:MAG: hypothetical protein CL878_07165 [Dehalococcoidia bacterium]|nr:hypothetical protein [Dehalococcoidia bacterium]